MRTNKNILTAFALMALMLTTVSAQNVSQYPYGGASRGNYSGFHMIGFGYLMPALIAVIVALLAAVIVLAYLLKKEKSKNKRHAR